MKEDESELSFKVISCKYADMYEKLGIKELGTVLSCSRDFSFTEGFNPEIELIRTKTIMGGSEYCDFRYVRKACQRDGSSDNNKYKAHISSF